VTDTPRGGAWIVAATVLGSGAVFLESTVVNVALPAIGRDFRLDVAGLQWVMSGYLVTLSALMLLGGALGDRFRRSTVFAVGLAAFAAATLCCALAPNVAVLLACRVVQGAAGALAVPNSLALLQTTFRGEARGGAIGRWAAWSAVSTALGPALGGWLVDAASWRWVFACVVPVALAAALLTWRHARSAEPERRPDDAPIDFAGAALATLALGGAVVALTTLPHGGVRDPVVLGAGAAAVVSLALLVPVERRARRPIVPLALFRARAFAGANLVTVFVYAGLGGVLFLLMLELQNALGYRALAAGSALLPVNALMLLISPRVGRLAERIGHRLPIAVGALGAGAGMALFARARPGASYLGAVLPAALVFGLGLSTFVAPISAAALRAAPKEAAGVASAVNNAVARLGGLLATALVPLAAGIGALRDPSGPALVAGFERAMWICAGLCVVGAAVALLTLPASLSERTS
jgi:EmrB/QacA subfamily drug resistance transporter